MSGRRIRMTLYEDRDHDLVMYYLSLKDKTLKNPDTCFTSVIKGVLKKYVRGDEFCSPEIKNFTKQTVRPKHKINIRFELDRKEDFDIIGVIDNIGYRQINSFLKNLLRRDLSFDTLDCYFTKIYRVNSIKGTKKTSKKDNYHNESVAVTTERYDNKKNYIKDSCEEKIPEHLYNRDSANANMLITRNNTDIPADVAEYKQEETYIPDSQADAQKQNVSGSDEYTAYETKFDFFGALGNINEN